MSARTNLIIYIYAEMKRMHRPKDVHSLWEYSIQLWTYDEILKRLINDTSIDILSILENMVKEFDDMICSVNSEDWKDRFLIAQDTTEFVLQQVLVW